MSARKTNKNTQQIIEKRKSIKYGVKYKYKCGSIKLIEEEYRGSGGHFEFF